MGISVLENVRNIKYAIINFRGYRSKIVCDPMSEANISIDSDNVCLLYTGGAGTEDLSFCKYFIKMGNDEMIPVSSQRDLKCLVSQI
jgi:hypothetical protein